MRRLVWVSFVILVVACKGKPSTDERLAEIVGAHRVKVEKVLDAIVALGKKPLPPVAGGFTVKGPFKNMITLPADPQILATYRSGKDLAYNWFDTGGVAPTVPRILAGEREHPDYVEKMMASYETIEKVLLVKTTEVSPEIADDKFTPGRIVADLYLFALDGTSLGSTRIEATNSASVAYEKRKNDNTAKSMVKADLDTNAKAALARALGEKP